MFANRDGYYSVNLIDLEALKKTYSDMVDKGTTVPVDDEKPAEAKNITEIIDSKSIKFKVGKDNLALLIYNDLEFVRTQVKSNESNSKSILTPIEVTITISGLSGFSCGEYFHIDGVPEMYNHIGVFQITNTKHTITPEGWETTLEAGFRIKPS
jgi:phosphatidate phosphatase PAH1